MHDSLDELPPADRPGPTGPRSPDGKARSSLNALKHGCRSEKTVLPDEDPAEFEATVQGWFDQYNPDTHTAITLVEQLAHAHWKLKRNQKRLEEVEWGLPGNAHHWTEDQQKRFANFSRYLTTAERSFLRYFKEVEAHYHRLHRDEHARQLAFAKLASIEFKRLDKADSAALKEVRFQQVVEIEVIDGKCTSSHYPSNQEVLEIVAERPTPPLYIARWLIFANGFVPREYAWARPGPRPEGETPQVLQRILWPQWLELIECERAIGTGHVGPLT